MQLVNTNYLREEALRFEKYGYYTDAPPGTKAFEEYWDEQTMRCLYGYKVGDVRITGFHYFYLNFTKILRVADKDKMSITGSRGVQKENLAPAFWDGDYDYFWAAEIARYGITRYWKDNDDDYLADEEKKKIYKRLDLGISIREDCLSGGRHMVVLKARGKGYSYKAASMLARNFALGKKSKNFALADDKTFLIEDGVLNKAYDVIAHTNDFTAWRHGFLKDTLMHKVAGHEKIVNGIPIKEGRLNEIVGITTKNDPDKARGKRGDIIFFEEAGKFPGLLKAWEVAKPSVEQGGFTTGIMIAYGTGGTDDAEYAGIEELFYNPDTYNTLAINNQWDDGAAGQVCSFFVPCWQNWEGYMDIDGNSFQEKAADYHTRQREMRRTSRDPMALAQYICENPFNPREATLNVTSNIFPTAHLVEQKNYVDIHKMYNMMTNGWVYPDENGKMKFIPDMKAKPLFNYIIPKGTDLRGCVSILESPIEVSGKVPYGMYIICTDPYAKDEQNVSSTSIGASYVLKVGGKIESTTYENCIVANYVGRPPTQDEYNEQLFNLAQYYNAKIAYEANRGENILAYAKRKRLLHYLYEAPSMMDKRERFARNRVNSYGLTVNTERKNWGQIYVRDWLNTPVRYLDDGNIKRVLNYIYDSALLEELIKFNDDGNFDRVSALIIGMFYLKSSEQSPKRKYIDDEVKDYEFFNRQLFS